jgi:hypothetical protein
MVNRPRRARLAALVIVLTTAGALVACSIFGPLPDVTDAPPAAEAGSNDAPSGVDGSADSSADVAIDAPAGNVQVFTYVGAEQTFIVPAGVTTIEVKLWGAAGGTTTSGAGTYRGGHGGFVHHPKLAVQSGETLTVLVGGGGGAYTAGPGGNPTASYADGGFGGGGNGNIPPGPKYLWSAGGGGRSAIRRSGVDLLSAGGGGGVGYPTIGATGNGGSACVGIDGAGENGAGPDPGGGATTTAGGAAGSGGTMEGIAGASLLGADGLSGSQATSGAGGGGLFGGGSGAFVLNTVSGAGGGGSCFVGDGGTVDPSGGVSDPDFAASAARGKIAEYDASGPVLQGTGAHGRVVIRW